MFAGLSFEGSEEPVQEAGAVTVPAGLMGGEVVRPLRGRVCLLRLPWVSPMAIHVAVLRTAGKVAGLAAILEYFENASGD